jgi:coenzyme PQQ precursor peptide PqqA
MARLAQFVATQHDGPISAAGKDFAGEVQVPYYFMRQGGDRPVFHNKECQMAWKTPKIVEVPVGMEINMYACAARK